MGKQMLRVAAALMLALACVAAVSAQEWPQRTIRVIVPFGPGGGSDIVARIVGQSLQERLGQSVVIENHPGAAGTIGNEIVAKAEKDGYTLGIMTAGQIIAAVTSKSLRYDTLADFAPVAQVATAGLVIVTRPDFPARNVAELIAAAKAHPGKLTMGSPGFGVTTQHLAGELFTQTAGVNLLHVAFRTSPEAITALLGNQIDVLIETVSAVIGQVKAGQLKALAVTGKERFPAVPDVPTAMESGLLPGYDVTTWYGFFAPRGTPPAVIAKLNKGFNDVIAQDAVRARLVTAGVVVHGSTPEAFGKLMADEYARWDRVRVAAGIPRQ
jgi:tripartite-type tricarboxylate transporter receptor subunit TctC